jgi:hypothetical protein
MRYDDRPPELAEEDEDRGGIFDSNSALQDTAILALNAGPAALLDVGMRDGQPRLVTITMARSFQPISPTALLGAHELIGHLQLGGSGAGWTLDFDFLQGQLLTVVASRVALTAEAKSMPGGIGTPPQTNVASIMAAVGAGGVSRARPPQRTLGSGAKLVAGDTTSYVIPAFAAGVQVVAVPKTAVLTIDVISVSTLQAASYGLTSYPSEVLPLPSDARVINVRNDGAADCTGHRLIFPLAM